MQNSDISQRNERTTKQMSLLDFSVLKTYILIMSGHWFVQLLQLIIKNRLLIIKKVFAHCVNFS